MMSRSTRILERYRQQKKLTAEIDRLEADKEQIRQIPVTRRSEAQQRFFDTVDESIEKLTKELMEL
jgi:hypothetical protein